MLLMKIKGELWAYNSPSAPRPRFKKGQIKKRKNNWIWTEYKPDVDVRAHRNIGSWIVLLIVFLCFVWPVK